VLFEILTGARAFPDADTTETIAAILRAEPEWPRLPEDTPESIRRLLRRCLEKSRQRRVADIRDARLEIEDAAVETPQRNLLTSDRRLRMERITWGTALALVALAAGAVSSVGGASNRRLFLLRCLTRSALHRQPSSRRWRFLLTGRRWPASRFPTVCRSCGCVN
jgi:hypothetical protein